MSAEQRDLFGNYISSVSRHTSVAFHLTNENRFSVAQVTGCGDKLERTHLKLSSDRQHTPKAGETFSAQPWSSRGAL
jgi:hypothetical protein